MPLTTYSVLIGCFFVKIFKKLSSTDLKNEISMFVFSLILQSSMGESVSGSSAGSPISGDAQGQVAFSVQFVCTSEERQTGKLIITVQVCIQIILF